MIIACNILITRTHSHTSFFLLRSVAQIYELEGLSVARVPRPDRSAFLGLLEDPRLGIFALLDEVIKGDRFL